MVAFQVQWDLNSQKHLVSTDIDHGGITEDHSCLPLQPDSQIYKWTKDPKEALSLDKSRQCHNMTLGAVSSCVEQDNKVT